jgi:hypothetical protein
MWDESNKIMAVGSFYAISAWMILTIMWAEDMIAQTELSWWASELKARKN